MNIIRKIDNLIFGKYKDQYGKELIKQTDNIHSLLDLGCGNNSPIKFIKDKVEKRVGVDLFEPSIQKSLKSGIHNDFKMINVLEVDKYFEPKSFDLVIASDLIEHLDKNDGFKLLDLMEKTASKKVIILTPNGFLKQGVYDDNDFQIHKSGWTTEEFESRGYKVYGIMGAKWTRGEYSYPTVKPNPLGFRISFLTQNSVYNNPKNAFAIMAVKEIK